MNEERTTKGQPASAALVRRLKKKIPLVGQNGIPLRDELELELIL